MTETLDRNVVRLKAETRGFLRAYQDLSEAEDDVDGHNAWASYVRHLKLSLFLAIRIGKQYPNRRAVANRYNNISNSHELVSFIVGSRNDIDHPEDDGKTELISGRLEPAHALVKTPTGEVMARIGARSSYFVVNSSFNGVPVDGFVMMDDEGKAKQVENLISVNVPKKFHVGSIRTIKGEIVPVPMKEGENVPYTGNEIADFGVCWLRQGMEVLLPKEVREEMDPFPQLTYDGTSNS